MIQPTTCLRYQHLLLVSVLGLATCSAVILDVSKVSSISETGGAQNPSTISSWSYDFNVQGRCKNGSISIDIFQLDNDSDEEAISFQVNTQTIAECYAQTPCTKKWTSCVVNYPPRDIVNEVLTVQASIGGDAGLCSEVFNGQTYYAYARVTLSCVGTNGPTAAPLHPTRSPTRLPTTAPSINLQALLDRVEALEAFVKPLSTLGKPLVHNLAAIKMPGDPKWLCGQGANNPSYCSDWLSTYPLHLKTSIVYAVGTTFMFDFEFRGQLYFAALPIWANVVGYIYSVDGNMYNYGVSRVNDAVTITYYKSSDSFLCLRVSPKTNWHASFISVDFRLGYLDIVPSILNATLSSGASAF